MRANKDQLSVIVQDYIFYQIEYSDIKTLLMQSYKVEGAFLLYNYYI